LLAEATRREITALRDRYPHPRSAILPCLWAVQNEQGYLSAEGMSEVAEILALAPSEVQAVSTFYSMYFARPSGEHHVLICINVSCALRGADEIVNHMERRLACPSGGTTADGKFTWESTVECLGGCGGAPAMQVDHHFHENLTPERVDGILERVRSQPSPHARAGAGALAPTSGAHPPTPETPPVADAAPGADASPIADSTEMPGPRSAPRAKPPGSRSRARRRPRPDASDL
jgi:NADH-quinone oxidoreductase subunit E